METAAQTTLTGLDWFMIVLYFGVLSGVAWWVVSKSKNTAADYFLAGRNLGWWIVGASIFASNIGSEHVVGLAGSGATGRRGDGALRAARVVPAGAGWVFVPFYMRSQVFTMPEFLERRFSPASRYVLSIVSLITFVVSKIAVGIFAGGVVFAHAAAGTALQHRRRRHRQLLGRLGPRHRADRALHGARWHARRRIQRRGAGRRPDRRLGRAHVLRALPARRLGRAARGCAAPTCSTCGSR